MNKDKKSCGCCCSHGSYKDELKVDLKKVANEIKGLSKLAKDKYDKLQPEQKKKLKKNLAIGAGVAAGLWGIKKALGKKK